LSKEKRARSIHQNTTRSLVKKDLEEWKLLRREVSKKTPKRKRGVTIRRALRRAARTPGGETKLARPLTLPYQGGTEEVMEDSKKKGSSREKERHQRKGGPDFRWKGKGGI